MGDQGPIYFFKEDEPQWGFLCQWYKFSFTSPKPKTFIGKNGVPFSCPPDQVWKTAEQYMMWHKATCFSDHKTAHEILLQGSNPRKCKALGKSTADFDNETWDRIKSSVVEEGSYCKFSYGFGDFGRHLRERFLETGERELVEASPFDRVWGVGFREEMLRRKVGKGGVGREMWGENRLGRALVVARGRIRAEIEGKEKIEEEGEGAGEEGDEVVDG